MDSIKKNRLRFGTQGPTRASDLKQERDFIERNERLANTITSKMDKTLKDLYPMSVTYKMTHSEIANKARKIALGNKQRIKDLALLSYITRLDDN